MQQIGPSGVSIYEDATYFTRSEGAFPVDESTNTNCATFLGLDECLDRHLKSTTLATLNELHNSGNASISAQEHLHQHLEFDIEDNGHVLNEMLQPQPYHQQHHHHHHHRQQQQQPHSVQQYTSTDREGQQQSLPPASSSQQQTSAAASWEESIHVLQEMLLLQQHQPLQFPPALNDPPSPHFPSTLNFANCLPSNTNSNNSAHITNKFPGESELLSLLQLPRCASSSMPSSIDGRKFTMNYSTSYPNADHLSDYQNVSIDYDPHFILQQTPSSSSLPYQVTLKNLFQNSSHGPLTSASTPSTLVHHLGGEEKEHNSTFISIDDGRQFGNPIFDFKRVDGAKGEPRGINHFATERQRREYLNEKYQTLRSLVPNPSKADRASIVQDAIEYVKELKRRVQELEAVLQERNRRLLACKKRKVLLQSPEETAGGTVVAEKSGCAAVDIEAALSNGRGGELLQRISQHGTCIDVRIVEEEVNIKLSHRRVSRPRIRPLPLLDEQNSNMNLGTSASASASAEPAANPILLEIALALHELQLDLLAANGAILGGHYVFMLNTKELHGMFYSPYYPLKFQPWNTFKCADCKVKDGTTIYASQVATKIMEVVDKDHCDS
ncbi:hypothetical protein KP509_14G094900 [Ceratopteris richardii]|uniref:BHLH domain-containing protein n=1 Tax=Ceratopteris richardii TaxID=49495 RepID=A0A8T2THN5_CERRI|nr:hypothetical protein KP509_14G094900 [Ceratopteris richardii]